MLSISKKSGATARDATAIAQYPDESDHRQGQSVEDYYVKAGTPGQWIGDGCAALGLAGSVDRDDFVRLLQGYHPHSKQPLVQNAGQERAMAYDLTFSAPKSVSAVWALADDRARASIQQAHNKAVERALRAVQEHALRSSRGHGRAAEDTGLPIAAAFQHGSSREMDPDIHTHCMLLNVTVRPDGSTGAVKGKDLFEWKMFVGAAYRAELAQELRAQGFAVEQDASSFKVAGVSQDLCDRWSKRRQQIVSALDNPEALGADAAKAKEVATLATRKAKREVGQSELQARWHDEAEGLGITQESLLSQVRQTAREQKANELLEPAKEPTNAQLLEKLTEHKSVVRLQEIYTTVAQSCQTVMTADQIETRVKQLMSDPELVRLQHKEQTDQIRYTTREMMRLERAVLASAARRAAETSADLKPELISKALADFADAKGFRLSSEQEAFVRGLCEQAGGVRAGVGDAGAGKSTCMRVLADAYRADHYRVLGCAPSGKAAAGLQESTGIESVTIHKLLRQMEPWTDDQGREHAAKVTLDNKAVVVVDEAGMVDLRAMQALLERCEQAGARCVLVGDPKQLQAVGPSGLFADLVKRTTHAPRLSEIRRQVDEEHRAAVRSLSQGEAAEAMRYYLDQGRLHMAESRDEAVAQAVNKWAEAYDRTKPEASIMLAATNADVDALNGAAREWLKQRHELVNEIQFQTRDRAGRPTGKIDIAEGDRLILKLNSKEFDGKNGDLATVAHTDIRDGRPIVHVQLDRTGETIPIAEDTYAQVRHAYSITTHASQGMTTDRAVALVGSLSNRSLAYVQLSRARLSTDIVMTKSALDEAAEQVQPTARMTQYAEALAKKYHIDEPAQGASFAEVRKWLNEHAPERIDSAGADIDPRLAEVADVIEAMSREQQSESTLDYVIDDPQQPQAQGQQQPADAEDEEELEYELDLDLSGMAPAEPEQAQQRRRGQTL